jgi:hypothetical protein
MVLIQPVVIRGLFAAFAIAERLELAVAAKGLRGGINRLSCESLGVRLGGEKQCQLNRLELFVIYPSPMALPIRRAVEWGTIRS